MTAVCFRSRGTVRLCVVGLILMVRVGLAEPPAEDQPALDLSGPTFARLSPGEKALLEEFHDNYRRLAEFYRNVTIEASETAVRPPGSEDDNFPAPPDAGPELFRVREYIYRARNGTHYRMDGSDYDPANQSSVMRSLIGIVTPGESHVFGRDRLTGVLYLVGHGTDTQTYLHELTSYAFHMAPFAAGPMELLHLILKNHPGRTVDYVRVDHSSSDEIVFVGLITEFPGGYDIVRLYRDKAWAMQEVQEEFGENKQYLHTHRCVYDGELNGFPLLKEYTFEAKQRNTFDGTELLQARQVFAIKAITPGAPDPSYFDASQFLKQIGGLGEKTTGSNLNLLLVINGVLLALLGLYLSHKASCRRPVS